jgi:hypothetical protein
MINGELEFILQYDFDIIHQMGIKHILPDIISRLFDSDPPSPDNNEEYMLWNTDLLAEEIPENWQLNPLVFLKIQEKYTPCTIDAFSSVNQHQLPVYFTKSLDAFTQDWSKERLWINVDPKLLPRIFKKLNPLTGTDAI